MSGQATLEYILTLSVAVILALVLIRQFVAPTFAKIQGKLVNQVKGSVFPESGFHHLRIRR